MTGEGDLVLIYFQDQPTVFSRIESIEPDIKKNWYHVTLLMLTIPVQTVTWIIRDIYIDGEPFTMGGRDIRLEKISRVPTESASKDANKETEKMLPEKAGTIIPFKKP